MPEVTAHDIEMTFDLTLSDYLAFQLWNERENRTKWFLIYVLVFIGFAIFSDIESWLSLAGLQSLTWSYWQSAILIALAGYVLLNAIPFPVVLAAWILNKLPRQMRILADREGVTVSLKDYDLRVPWSALLYMNENRSAYLLRFKSLFVRLPKRELAQQQIAEFEAIVRGNAPASSFKPIRP